MHIMFNSQFESEGEMEKVAVIALGNTLRKDDAVGIVLRKRLGKIVYSFPHLIRKFL